MKANRNKLTVRNFSLVELVIAMGLFIIVAASFYSVTRALGEYRDRLMLRSQAGSIIDNTLERVSAYVNRDAETAATVFRDELEKNSFSGGKAFQHACEIRNGRLILGIFDKKGKSLAEVHLSVNEKEGTR